MATGANTMRPKKSGRSVRKSRKKAWRKADISDVEAYLEDKRIEEKTGGPTAEKLDNQLFYVDNLTTQNRRQVKGDRKQTKSLRCYSHLELDPNIRPVKVSHCKRPCGDNRRRSLRHNKPSQADGFSQSHPDTKKPRLTHAETQKRTPTRINTLPITGVQDLWAETDKVEHDGVDVYHKQQTKQELIARRYKPRSSELAAVEVPHAGSSYNPDYMQHQDLLAQAVQKEEVKEKEERKIQRAVNDVWKNAVVPSQQDLWLSEMSAGLGEKQTIDSDCDEDRVNPSGPVKQPVRREDKKTLKQRRKESERLAQEKSIVASRNANVTRNQIFRLKSIQAQVKSREKMLAERMKARSEKKMQLKNRPKKLGKTRYEEPPVAVKLTEELVGSFREITPEGHLLEDRLKSLQKRNILEARERSKVKRQYKRKAYTKKSHRDDAV